MYLPRALISHLYTNLQRTRHAQSSPVLLLVALEPDALCACRILTALFKRDYISHNIIPVAGYADLARAGEQHVQPMRLQNGGSGGTVVCLGVGGLVDLGAILGLEPTEEEPDATGGVEIWVVDARRPWNLGNVFGGEAPDAALDGLNGNTRVHVAEVEFGEIKQNYRPGKGGVVVFDDGDIGEELEVEREAYFKLLDLPPIEDDGQESDDSETESEDDGSDLEGRTSKKRKSWSDADEMSEDEGGRPRQRRRSDSLESSSSSPSRPARRGLLSTATVIPNSNPSQPQSHSSPPPSHQVRPISTRRNRRRLLRLKRKHEATLHAYYSLGTSYSEPISSLVYSLASDLGREDNNALWNAIVGVSSLELYGRSTESTNGPAPGPGGYSSWGGTRGERIRQVLRDEVRRLNPPDPKELRSDPTRGESSGVIPTTASSPTDTSIRLSPEPRFLLIRHWSLYDSMLHSPYLATRLHVWNDVGRKRLHKLLAKMGMSLQQCKQSYTHMDMDLKRGLRQRLLKYAPLYGLEGLVPPPAVNGRGREGWGFVRSWGWKACLSAVDVSVIIGAILEVGKGDARLATNGSGNSQEAIQETGEHEASTEGEEYVERFWKAYDALDNVSALTASVPPTLHLHRAILRTGTALLSKHQIRHLRAFRMGVVRDGPDVQLFTHPGALTKLALWVGEAIAEQGKEKGGKNTPLVLAALNERRGIYVIVGTGGGGIDVLGSESSERKEEERKKKKEERARRKEEKTLEKEKKRAERAARKAARRQAEGEADGAEDDDDDDEAEEDEEEEESSDGDDSSDEEEDDGRATRQRAVGRNRFGLAFQEVVEETRARVRIDSFEHCVVEVRKEDLGGFLEALSTKSVMG